MRQIIQPAVAGMCEEGTPFLGFLYAGLMIDNEGVPAVLEFNCRLGDPETQPILMRLRSDLIELCAAAFSGRLARSHAEWDKRVALGVVMAAEGYPGTHATGDVIHGLEAVRVLDATKVFHAGSRLQDGSVVTAGVGECCAWPRLRIPSPPLGLVRMQSGVCSLRENRLGRTVLLAGHRPRGQTRLILEPRTLRSAQVRFIASKNSSLVFDAFMRPSKNSIASVSSIWWRNFLSTQSFCSPSGLINNSSRRVPERLMLIAG